MGDGFMHMSPTRSSTEKHGVSPENLKNSHGCPLPIHRGVALSFRGSRYVVAGGRMGGDCAIKPGTRMFRDLVVRAASALHKGFLEGR